MPIFERRHRTAISEYSANQTPTSFREMVDNGKSIYRFKEGKAVVFNVSPRETRNPPVVLSQGWGVVNPRYPNKKAIIDGGNNVVSLHIDTAFGNGEIIIPTSAPYSQELARKANVQTQVLENQEVLGADGVGISAGASTLLLSAAIAPEKYRNIALINAPLIQIEPKELMRNWTREEALRDRDDSEKKQSGYSPIEAVAEVTGYILKSPWRAWREIEGIASTDLLGLIRFVRKKGIKVSAISASADGIFNIDKVWETVKREHREGYSPFNHFEVVPGGHNEPGDSPTRIRLALKMLDSMRNTA